MKHFTTADLIVTNIGIKNIPDKDQVNNIVELIRNVLNPLVDIANMPITINSGFRSKEVNEKVGGVANSQHVRGQAADITSSNNKLIFELIKNNLPFDQLINEQNFKWIHVSYSTFKNRKQILAL